MYGPATRLLAKVARVDADVNWLLSSLAQSTAALIAIVGGLLVSRYVSLHAEQSAAGRRVDDLGRRLGDAERRHQHAKAEIEAHELAEAIEQDDVYDLYFRTPEGEVPTREQVIAAAEADAASLNTELLDRRIPELFGELHSAFTNLDRDVPISTRLPYWDDFRKGKGYSIQTRGAWEWMYETIGEVRKERARKDRPFDIPSFDATISDRHRLTSPQEQAQVDRLYQTRDQAATDMRQLEEERRLATETYEAARQPEGFRLALEVFSALAVVGLLVPISIMAVGVATLPLWLRLTLVALFIVGLGLLLRFLFVYANKLRGTGGEIPLPPHIWGLLRRTRARISKDEATPAQ
jgi:hypothetical protein